MSAMGKWIVPIEGPWKKVTEKEVCDALKRMKNGESSGPSDVLCEMFSNEVCVCVRELCGLVNGLLMEENMPVMKEEYGCSLV